jgi:hypothetical protein
LTPHVLDHDYGRLSRFLKGLSFRYQLLAIIECLLLLASGVLLVLLGSLFVLKFKEAFPYIALLYAGVSILFIACLFWLGARRIFRRPSVERVARGLEEKFPTLRDDVTNSILLVDQMKEGSTIGQVSKGLVMAQLRRTIEEVDKIKPEDVVSLKKGFRHLRLLVPLLVSLALVLIIDPQVLARSLALIVHPLSGLPMRQTFISLEPEKAIVARGTALDIRASATGNLPEKLLLLVWPEEGEPGRFVMEPEGYGRFRYRMAAAQRSFRYQASSSSAESTVGSIRVVDPPELGKIKLTLIPPDYTHLPEEVRGDGHIDAMKGTVVNIEVRATKAVTEGQMVLNEGSLHPLEVRGERLSGSLLVLDPGTYAIRVKDEFGFGNPNPVHYQIRVMPDKYPEAEIASPAQDLEIAGDEVIPLVYSARDDFGITSIRLMVQARGEERIISLKGTKEGRFIGPETFKWDLSSLALNPGDSATYRVEAEDNDAVSGPKKGYSRSFALSVRDERARASREGEEAQRLVDALLDLLADQVEGTRNQEGLTKQVEEIMKQVDKTLDQIGNSVERFDLEALKRNLASLKERMGYEPSEKVTQEMERLALLAEDIAKGARLGEVEALAREIKNRQRHLIDALKDLKGPLTKEGMETIMKELKKLEELLKSVMEALGNLATRLPDEFVNSQELSGLEFQDLFGDLEEMYKKLMAGDVEGALEAAQRLMQTLSEMMASLGRAGTRAGTSPFDRLQGEMSRQQGELDKILAEQKEILSETGAIDSEIREAMQEETKRRLDELLPRMTAMLEQLRRLLPHEQEDMIDSAEGLLKSGRLEGLSSLMKELERQLGGRPDEEALTKEVRRLMEGLAPDPREVLQQLDVKRFPGLSERQEKLEQRTRAFLEKLEMFAQLFPGMDTEILKNIESSAGFMGEAAGRLKGQDAPAAIPPEQEAMRMLAQSQQGMQQMAQQMGQRMQAGRWGYPLVYDPRPGWYYGPWVPMPTLPQPELNFPREKGHTGIDREEFEPPSKDAYRAPKMFRERVMDALKEGVPSQYKREVERYFRGLTQ